MMATHKEERENFDENLNEHQMNEDYQKVKSYLLLLRVNIADQKEIGEKFFTMNKNQAFLHQNLNLIIQNLEEKDDLRIQATVMLKKLYNEGNTYLTYNKDIIEEDYEQEKIAQSIKNHRNLALPQGVTTEILSKNLDIYDSLPYIDGHYMQEARLKEEMKKLIHEQMTVMKGENPAIEEYYLGKIPIDDVHLKFNKDTFHSDPLLKSEMERVEKGKKLDVFRNSIQTVFHDPPPSKTHDEYTWNNLIEGINFSLQQFNVKNFNLDLLIKYGPNMWKRYLKGLECLLNQLETEKLSLEKKIEDINQKRKFSQIEALEKLNELSEKKKYNLYQNAEVHKQILKLRFKMKKLIKYKKNKLRIKKKQMMKSKLSNK